MKESPLQNTEHQAQCFSETLFAVGMHKSALAGYFHQQELSVFESTMRLNYLGVVASVQCLYPRMVQRNSGHICLVSSVMGTMGRCKLIFLLQLARRLAQPFFQNLRLKSARELLYLCSSVPNQ